MQRMIWWSIGTKKLIGCACYYEYDVNDELETRLMKVLYSLRSSDSNATHIPTSGSIAEILTTSLLPE